MTPTIAAPAVLLVFVFLCGGCAGVTRPLASWEIMDSNGPWARPGQRAVLESRSYFISQMANVQGHDERWRSPDGQTRDAWELAREFLNQMEKTGELAKWQPTQSHYGKWQQRLGPYKIYLGSVFPSIYLLVPHDYGSIENRSINDLVGDGQSALSDPRAMNHLYFGVALPYASGISWASPDLGVPVTRVVMRGDNEFLILHDQVELIGRRRDHEFQIERRR